jgi:hypothetical protein
MAVPPAARKEGGLIPKAKKIRKINAKTVQIKPSQ